MRGGKGGRRKKKKNKIKPQTLLIALLLQELEKKRDTDERRVPMFAISNACQSHPLNFLYLQSVHSNIHSFPTHFSALSSL